MNAIPITTHGAASDPPATGFDFDWVVVGSGFGGSVAALRLAEKGDRVGVIERGRSYEDGDLPRSTTDIDRFVWAPDQGLYGILRDVAFQHVETASQTGVGGGSLMYGGVLFRAQEGFYDDPQWRNLGSWQETLAPHFDKAEHMLGVSESPWDSVSIQLTKRIGEHFGVADSFGLAPTGVFFGEPGKTVDDPYFGGEGPARTGCTRCGDCMIGCRTGAANRLTKNYLWFAQKRGAQIIAEQEVVDVRTPRCPRRRQRVPGRHRSAWPRLITRPRRVHRTRRRLRRWRRRHERTARRLQAPRIPATDQRQTRPPCPNEQRDLPQRSVPQGSGCVAGRHRNQPR